MSSPDASPAAGAAPPRIRRWQFLLLWLVLAAGLIAWDHRFYFVDEHWEVGDAAANALQIRQAKHFNELHGNYSRFRFHHPGPGFFYAYGAGETLLYDLLKVVPSPYNAHVFVGVLLQTGFFAWALAIVARHVRQKLVVPLIVVFAALHFGAVNYNIPHSIYESIWPPHVLLFPFLCFVVACASLAAGSTKDILAAAAAGSLLVHGHVAQPLFVVPMFAAAVVGWLLQLRASGEPLRSVIRKSRGALIAAAVVLVVFVAPLAIDATRGDESNFAKIVHHLSDSAGERKTLLQSLNYLGSLACYVPDPEKFSDQLTDDSLTYARDRWYVAVGWLLLAAAIAASFRLTVAGARFPRVLLVFFALAILLMIRWGVMQSGPMYAFNSHFAFALLFVPMIVAAVAIARVIGARSAHRLAPFALMLAIPAFVASTYDWRVWPRLSPGPAFKELAPVAKSEPHRKKFLLFPGHEWPWAIGIALQLRRLGMDYRVERQWGFMFGEKKTLSVASALRSTEMQLWEIGADPATRSGFQLGGGPFVATLPRRLNPNATEIRFDGEAANVKEFAAAGWGVTDEPHAVTNARRAVLYFSPLPANWDVEVTLDIFPAALRSDPPQRILVSFNGERLHESAVSSAVLLKVIVPAALWNAGEAATLLFEFPDAVSPRELGISAEEQRAAFGFRSISFRELPAP